MHPNRHHTLGSIGLVGALLVAPFSMAEDSVDLAAMRQLIEEQTKQLAEIQRGLDEQKKKLEEQRRLLSEQRRRLEEARNALVEKKGTASGPSVAVAAADSKEPASNRVGRAPGSVSETTPPEVAAIADVRGVLTPKGKFVLEPSLQYSHSSTNRVSILGFSILPAIIVGDIEVSEVNHDSFIGALTTRYGVTSRFELEAKLPYVYRNDNRLERPFNKPTQSPEQTSETGRHIGDVELGARYQFNGGEDGWPFLVGNLRLKTHTGKSPFDVTNAATGKVRELPTGSGFYGVQPSLTAIIPSDPAIFFGSVSYLWNIKRNVGKGFGEIDPGDALGFNFGLGLALNDRASLSLGYDHSVIGKTTGNGFKNARTTQVGSLLLGYAYRVSDQTSLNLSLGVGVTDASPDMQLTLRVPYTF